MNKSKSFFIVASNKAQLLRKLEEMTVLAIVTGKKNVGEFIEYFEGKQLEGLKDNVQMC